MSAAETRRGRVQLAVAALVVGALFVAFALLALRSTGRPEVTQLGAGATASPEQQEEVCRQQEEIDYVDDPEYTSPDPATAIAEGLRRAQERLTAQVTEPYEEDVYPGYALAVARAKVEGYAGLEPIAELTSDTRAVFGVGPSDTLSSRVVAERGAEPGSGWMVTEESWVLPESVCNRLDERNEGRPSDAPTESATPAS